MKKSICVIIVLCILVSFTPASSYAQDQFSLGIYPPIFQIDATPPSLIIQDLSIQNFTEQEVPLTILIRPFKPSSLKNGQISYDTDRFGGPDSLIKQKINILDQERSINSITLAPLEIKKLHLGIDIKEHDPAGDYYFSIIFQSGPEGSEKGLSIPAGIGTNILLSVGPKGPTRGQIDLFTSKSFYTNGPVPFQLLVKNKSNHYIEPTGSISIQNMFGQHIAKIDILPQAILANSQRYLIDTKQINPDKQSDILSKVYPKSSSSNFENQIPVVVWPENFLFGYYTAKLSLSLSENGPLLTSYTHFFALPLPILLGIIATLFITIGIYLRVKKKRKYKQL